MKLITKHRDYYDHIIHIHGVDPLQVWKRKPTYLDHKDVGKASYGSTLPFVRPLDLFPRNIVTHLIVVNETVYVYAEKLIINMFGLVTERIWVDAEEAYIANHGSRRWSKPDPWAKVMEKLTARYGKLTDHFGEPIVAFTTQPDYICHEQVTGIYVASHNWWKNPLLSNLPLTAELPPQEMYEEIQKFFCRTCQPKDPAPQPEFTRIEASGFDLKTSFRHRK